MLNKLVKIANKLDELGLTELANVIDEIIKNAGNYSHMENDECYCPCQKCKAAKEYVNSSGLMGRKNIEVGQKDNHCRQKQNGCNIE